MKTAQYQIAHSPLGGYMLINDEGLVVDAGQNIEALKMSMRIQVENRTLSPFIIITDEYGDPISIKEYIR